MAKFHIAGKKFTTKGAGTAGRSGMPGITGGALESKEGEPGPILLQGDHDPIEFRNIITPKN